MSFFGTAKRQMKERISTRKNEVRKEIKRKNEKKRTLETKINIRMECGKDEESRVVQNNRDKKEKIQLFIK